MNPTAQFLCVTLIGALISGAVISFSRSPEMTRRIAWSFYIFAIALRVALLIITLLAISLIAPATHSKLAKILFFPGSLVIGVGLASVGFVLWESIRGAHTNATGISSMAM